jgi:hypothetical protein
VKSDVSAEMIATPADGPSFGVAPSGKWRCRSTFSNVAGVQPHALGVGAQPREGRGRRLLHDVAELAGEVIEPLPGILVASMKRMSPKPSGV